MIIRYDTIYNHMQTNCTSMFFRNVKGKVIAAETASKKTATVSGQFIDSLKTSYHFGYM